MQFASGEYRLLIIDSIIACFRVDYSGRGELAERQQALGQLLSRLTHMASGMSPISYQQFSVTLTNIYRVQHLCSNGKSIKLFNWNNFLTVSSRQIKFRATLELLPFSLVPMGANQSVGMY